MSNQPIHNIQPSSSVHGSRMKSPTEQARQAAARQARQVEGDNERAQDTAEYALFGPNMRKNAESLEKRSRRYGEKVEKGQDEEAESAVIDAVTKSAEEFEQRNPEMDKRALLGLRRYISPGDTPEEILDKVLAAYPDHYLADEALAFLIENTSEESKLLESLKTARNLLNDRFGRQIRAGRNMSEEAREFAKQGLGSASSLRELYNNITENPKDPITLFNELSDEFSFDKMKTVISFILHSVGKDLKSGGPSIERGLLQNLFEEARSMQAILGVYRFFYNRMRLIMGLFTKEELTYPQKLNFEFLAKIFVKYLQERYPSPEKIFAFADLLGISEELAAQVIIFTQFRDAIRGVSPRLFKSNTHRQDLLMALIETISELDDLLEEDDDDDETEDDEEDENTPKGWNQKDVIK